MSEVKTVSEKRLCLLCQLVFVGTTRLCPNDGTPLVAIADPLIGTDVAQGYKLLEQIGRGAMGSVYKAVSLTDPDEIVAVKVLHKSLLNDVEPVRRFQLEAQLTSRLSHRNIVSVDDYGIIDDGRPYMIMDLIEGTGINDIVDREGPMDVARALPIFQQLASALGHAHNNNIVHRDVKLSNVMLVNMGHQRDVVKLVDFGIAKHFEFDQADGEYSGNNEGITAAGQVVGSPLYMSPEQCMGQPLDHRTDIYSLGCVMYYVLTGHPVFSAESVVELMQQQISRQPGAMASPSHAVPQFIEEIVFNCLAKMPEDRYQSMEELEEELEIAMTRLVTPQFAQVKLRRVA